MAVISTAGRGSGITNLRLRDTFKIAKHVNESTWAARAHLFLATTAQKRVRKTEFKRRRLINQCNILFGEFKAQGLNVSFQMFYLASATDRKYIWCLERQ
jgi:hypothetical protein